MPLHWIPDDTPADGPAEFLGTGRVWPVSSSNVATLQYDPEHELLTVGYGNGDRWEYGPVSRGQAEDLALVPSKGTWLWDHVRVRGKGNRHRHQVAHAVQLS